MCTGTAALRLELGHLDLGGAWGVASCAFGSTSSLPGAFHDKRNWDPCGPTELCISLGQGSQVSRSLRFPSFKSCKIGCQRTSCLLAQIKCLECVEPHLPVRSSRLWGRGMLGIKFTASHVLGKHSTTALHPRSLVGFLMLFVCFILLVVGFLLLFLFLF